MRRSFEASTKKNVGQQKQKLNNLKNSLKAQTKVTTTEETENTEKPTYTQVLRKSQSPWKRQNITIILNNKIKPKVYERLLSMSTANKHEKQGKTQSRTICKTSNANDYESSNKKMNFKKKKKIKKSTKTNYRN